MHWESLQKIFLWWYYTPTKLAKIYPNSSPLCWKNCGLPETLYYIWNYPFIKDFWTQTSQLLKSFIPLTLNLISVNLLVGLAILTWPRHFQTLAMNILNFHTSDSSWAMEISPFSDPVIPDSNFEYSFLNGILFL